MIGAIKNTSVRGKLWFLFGLNAGIGLVAGFTLFCYENLEQRDTARRELSMQARIIGESSTAALTFGDQRAAAETLAMLHGDPNVIEAALYDRNNRLFAQYKSDLAVSGIPVFRRHATNPYFENGAIVSFEPIRLRNEQIGTVFIKSTMDEIYAGVWRYVAIVCVVLIIALGLALLLSSHLQKLIANPVAELSAVARHVAVESNYSIRAVRHGDDDIGKLIDSFNEMLARIETQELARRSAEESLRESEERYALAVRGANDGLWDWKFSSDRIYFSPRWNQMLGYPATETWSDCDGWFRLIHPSDRARVRAAIATHRDGKTPEFSCEYRMRHRRGAFIWVLSRGIAVRDTDGNAIRMAGSQTDITEGKVADPLTGLPNRLYFLDKVEHSIEGALQRGRLFAVLFLDLDRFKLVNDSLGHAAGDELLVGIAAKLRSSVRGADSEFGGEASVVARLGGDEFAILLNGLSRKEDALIVADRILKQMSSPFQVSGRQMVASVSIGIALSSSANTPEDLVRNADTAMYYAKTGGKARYELFDEKMRDRALARIEIETDLRKAIDDHQLMLYYQPKVRLKDQRIVGYEALVRWNHPKRGLLGPGEFVPIAEDTDLILPLGRWVLKEACRQMAEWQRTMCCDPNLTVSVNVSFKQLTGMNLVEEVRDILAETGLNPECLTLEMTESTIMANAETALVTLGQLKDMHVALELDDFGTGYSSLSYLSRLPFDTVKIDRSFVRELGTGEEKSDIVKTILELASSMNLRVVAEGVETVDQIRELSALGCKYVQGFYFSRPVSPQATVVLMRERDNPALAFWRTQTLTLDSINPDIPEETKRPDFVTRTPDASDMSLVRRIESAEVTV
jgi:diguanylate cyclase (GGDEF)-like protein/PAS domain S-box-containing protein